jgi:IPT/TIG domain
MQSAMRLAACACLLAAVSLPAVGSATAQASAARGYRVERVCRAPRPGRAACLAAKLVPASLSASELQASAREQSREAASGEHPAVDVKAPEPGYLTPQRLHAAYALPSETRASPLQTIALVDAFDDPHAEADLAVYDAQFALPACTAANGCFRKLNQSGAASPLPPKQGEWAGEISIDVQMAHAICPGCRILLVEASSEEFGDLGAAVDTAASLGATEISNSYGAAEEAEDASLDGADYEHPGVVVAASSGDCGYLNKACSGEEEIGANFPASATDVLAVGGTSLSESKGAWSSTVWSEGGSGCSDVFDAGPWQSAVASFAATGCGAARSVADVAAIGDPDTGVDVYDSVPEGHGAPTGWGVWGGTSVASPILAAEFALAGGARGAQSPSATLYAHLGESAALYDVVSGHNGSCAGASACKAASGYDGPTGVGSPTGLEAFSLPGAPVDSTPPTIAGDAEQGQTLTVVPGGWSGAPTSIREQWARCNASGSGCSPIAGATGSSYTLGAADLGATIRVQETAANASGEGAPTASAQTAVVASGVPSISAFTPSSAITGSLLTIEGSALDGVDEVTIGKLSADFTVISSTRIEAIVPNGVKPGKLAVSGPSGAAATKLKFTPTLSVTGFSPKHGAAGKSVTIKGVGFTHGSQVAFDGVSATAVQYVSASKLEATVPEGASSGLVTVTNASAPAGTVSSASSFSIP